MGMDWDPEGDAERRKEGRVRLLLTIGIVVAILGFVGKMIHQYVEEKRRKELMMELSRQQSPYYP